MALADLQAQIADDLARGDLSTQITSAITTAIQHYWSDRFYFNETRDVTFPTVPGKYVYTVTDNANIPLFFDWDDLFLIVTGTQIRLLRRADQPDLEYLIANSGNSKGEPRDWAWYNQQLWLYPIPNLSTYTVRIAGAYRIAAPTDPTDAVNPWITEAFEMILCYAKGLLYLHTLHDTEKAAEMMGADGKSGWAGVAKRQLIARGNKTRGFGMIRATEF